MIKRHNQYKTALYAVKLIQIDGSVSVKAVRKELKLYTREVTTFRKRVTNMIKKGDWNLYI